MNFVTMKKAVSVLLMAFCKSAGFPFNYQGRAASQESKGLNANVLFFIFCANHHSITGRAWTGARFNHSPVQPAAGAASRRMPCAEAGCRPPSQTGVIHCYHAIALAVNAIAHMFQIIGRLPPPTLGGKGIKKGSNVLCYFHKPIGRTRCCCDVVATPFCEFAPHS